MFCIAIVVDSFSLNPSNHTLKRYLETSRKAFKLLLKVIFGEDGSGTVENFRSHLIKFVLRLNKK